MTININIGNPQGPAGPAGAAVAIPANTIVANATNATANPSGVSASTARTLLGLAAVSTSGSASDLQSGELPSSRIPAVAQTVTSRATLLASTASYLRWHADEGGEFKLSSDQDSDADNVMRIERTDGTIVERVWDGVNFSVEWVPMGLQVGTWGVTSATINGDKLTAAADIAPSGTTLQLKTTTYNVDLPLRFSGVLKIQGNGATIKRSTQRSSLLTANSSSGTNTVTVANGAAFRVGQRVFVVKTAGVLGGHAMVNGTSELYGSSGFLVSSINGNVVTLGENLRQDCVIGNKLVALDSLILADTETARIVIEDVTFDGDKTNHADVLDWAAGYGISIYEGIIVNCRFKNMPNENVSIGRGAVVNCQGDDLFGSFVHISSAADNARGLLIQNCYTKNTNTKNSGHDEGVITFSNNSRNIRVKDCIFDNSAGTKGTGVFATLDSSSVEIRDANIFIVIVTAYNLRSIISLSITTGLNFDRVAFSKCSFIDCGQLLISASIDGNVADGPYIKHVAIENCEFVNCWVVLRSVRHVSWKDNVYRWDFGPGVYAGAASTFAGLPTTRIGGTSLAEGDIAHLFANNSPYNAGVFVRTSGAWVRSTALSDLLPDTSIYAGLLVYDCGFFDASGGEISGPPFVSKDVMACGILLLNSKMRRIESGVTTFVYMEVSLSNIFINSWFGGVVTRTDSWWNTPIGYDVASWSFNNLTVYTIRDSGGTFTGGPTGIQVPAGARAVGCNVYLSDTSTESWATGIQLQGPSDATKTIGGVAIGCYVPVAPGAAQALRHGLNSSDAANKNCMSVGNVLAKSVFLSGTHDSVQSNNVVISLAGMTDPRIPPWRRVGQNENLY